MPKLTDNYTFDNPSFAASSNNLGAGIYADQEETLSSSSHTNSLSPALVNFPSPALDASQITTPRALRRHYAILNPHHMGVPSIEESDTQSEYQYIANASLQRNNNHKDNTFYTEFDKTSDTMSVDYSRQDFRSNMNAINEATKHTPTGGMRVRQEGDTTITTEHRDPYSFYWKMDVVRPPSPEPLRRPHIPPPPPPPKVIEEVMDE
jgi:hypothetical protein